MGLIISISLRNLFRQKRRNILLGIAIAVGVMVLVMASAFSKGISDVLFNKIITYTSGHIAIDFHEKGGMQSQIFRDKDRIDKIINENIPNTVNKNESLGIFTRAIGNGKSDNVVVVGIDYSDPEMLTPAQKKKQKEDEDAFRTVEGKWEDLNRKDVANPGLISIEKAKELNVKLGDSIRVRFQNVFGQWQAATITIVGVLKNENVFMNAVMFIKLTDLKGLMGYKPFETGPIQINIPNPKEAKQLADKLHAALQPGLAAVHGDVKTSRGTALAATVMAFKSTESAIKFVKENLKLEAGDMEAVTAKDGVALSSPLAVKLGKNVGDTVEFSYKNKLEDKITIVKYVVKGIYEPKGFTGEDVILMNENKLYESYFENLPEQVGLEYLPKKGEKIYEILATEWVLLERSKSTDDLMKKMKDIGKKKYKGVTVDVNSMYESASDILKLEYVLKGITGFAGLILFFIILIGVVNTLRMTIRERTREIGTVRAIGMQKKDVRNTFIFETFFLTLFASIAGVIMAVVLIALLSQITMNTEGNPMAMLLVKQHLHFIYAPEEIAFIIVFIHIIAVGTAFFPARKAAEMSPSAALRHYE